MRPSKSQRCVSSEIVSTLHSDAFDRWPLPPVDRIGIPTSLRTLSDFVLQLLQLQLESVNESGSNHLGVMR